MKRTTRALAAFCVVAISCLSLPGQSTYDLFKESYSISTLNCNSASYSVCWFSTIQLTNEGMVDSLPSLGYGGPESSFIGLEYVFDGGKVYTSDGWFGNELLLLYDFDLEVGESTTYWEGFWGLPAFGTVIEKGSLFLENGSERRYLVVDSDLQFENVVWIEGIGNSKFITPFSHIDGWGELICVRDENDAPLLSNSNTFVGYFETYEYDQSTCEKLLCPKLTANFDFYVDSLEAHFINNTSNGDAFSWDFGDGNSSTESNPKHSYDEAGCYLTSLTVYDECWERSYTTTKQINTCSQNNWDYFFPTSFQDISFIDDKKGWGITNDSIYFTNDGGITWQTQYFDPPESVSKRYFQSIHMIDSLIGYAETSVGNTNDKSLLVTNNGGQEWKDRINGSGTVRAHISDSGIGYAYGKGILYRTDNYGSAWIRQNEDCPIFEELFCLNDTVIGARLFEDNNVTKVYISTDAGLTFSTSEYSEIRNDAFVRTIVATNAKNIFVGGAKNRLVKTHDGGSTWESVPMLKDETIVDIDFMDKVRGWAVGWKGIHKTEDGGITWQYSSCGSEKFHRTISAVNDSTIYCSSRNNFGKFVLDTVYNCAYNCPPMKIDVDHSVDSNVLTIVTDAEFVGKILWDFGDGFVSNEFQPVHSYQNEGCYNVTMTAIDLCDIDSLITELIIPICIADPWKEEDNATGIDIEFVDEAFGWIITEDKIWHTQSGGANWIEQPFEENPFGERFHKALDMADKDHGIIACDIANGSQQARSLLITKNGGKTWKRKLETYGMLDAKMRADGFTAAISNDKRFFTSDDFGAAMQLVNLNQMPDIKRIQIMEGETIFGFGEMGGVGFVAKSYDKGATWSTSQWTKSTTVPEYNCFYFIDENHGFVGRNGGILLYTNDGAETIDTSYIGAEGDIVDIEFANDSVGWFVCSSGDMYKTVDGGSFWQRETCFTNSSGAAISVLSDEKLYTCSTSGWASFDGSAENPCAQSSSNDDIGKPIWKVYPNPAQDKVYIQLPKEGRLQIVDINGIICHSVSLYEGNHELSIHNLPSGIYYISYQTQDGRLDSKRLIKID